MTPLEALAAAYEAERFRWDWRRDLVSGHYQVLREKDDHTIETPSYEILFDLDDLHAAGNMADKMGQDAGARAMLMALAEVMLNDAYPEIDSILKEVCRRLAKED